MKKIQIVGGPGSGKSTLSKRLSEKYNLSIIELDALFWKPNWEESSTEEFISKIEKAMSQSKNGWVIDGSYTGKVGKFIQPKLDTLIYLQIPPYVTVPRALKRSLGRIYSNELLWGTNNETVLGSFKLAWWTVKSYRSRVKRMHTLKNSNTSFEMLIFKSNKEANNWFKSLE